MHIKVLGPVEVEHDGEQVNVGGPRQRRLLAVLLLQRGRAVPTDRLVEATWPDGDVPDGAARSMRTYLSRLRMVLPGASITTQHGGYVLDVNGASVDLDEFDNLLDGAEASLPDRAVDGYDRALRLWRGEPFGGFADEWWALPEASRLRERRFAAEIARAEARMAIGHHNRAIPDLERLVAERPLDERAVTLLMQALAATGRQAEAMRIGRAFRTRLVDSTGLEPSDELRRWEHAIAAGNASTAPSAGRPLRGYTLHEAIGEGAHGRVYNATQPGTERRVAVKVIRPDLADSSAFIERFDAEAKVVARLEHPHIVPLYDAWREPGGAFLVFRLLGGGTLRDSVVGGGPWSVPNATQLVDEIGGALMTAHAADVVHGDVRSTNVLLDDDGAAYLGDFGIALGADDATPGSARARGDVRDFGAVLVEALTGDRAAVPNLVGRVRPLPDGLETVLRRAIDGNYDSVAELVLAWHAAVDDTSTSPTVLSSDRRRVVDSARRVAAHRLVMAASAGINPYRGLRPFGEGDAALFHGRAAAVADLASLVTAHPFVAVVGSSGSGKSSLVLAGLVPTLRSDGATVVTMMPGSDPLDALRTALSEVAVTTDDTLTDIARRGARLVLVVDQFEECWTATPQERRDVFLATLVGAAFDDTVDVRVVTTVRADLLDAPLSDASIGQLLATGTYVVAPMSPGDLREAITAPAAAVGVTFDEGVVADLITETASAPGSLPLLQFTLTELYDRRVDSFIGRDALDDVGGMAASIGRRAQAVHDELDPSLHPSARDLFERLVTVGPDQPDMRRRATLGELSASMRTVADRFVAARLLVADRNPATREPTVEVAHEALLSRWPQLAAWLEADRRWLTQLQHLSVAARMWDDAGRSEAELYRGARLEAALEAIDEGGGRAITNTERAFVEAGRRARHAGLVEAQRTTRRLRRRLNVVAVALVVALGAGLVAFVQRDEAENARADASAAAGVAEEQRDAAAAAADSAEVAARDARIEALVGEAESLRSTQRDTAALLAVESFRLADTPRTRSTLFATFTDDERFLDAHHLDGERGSNGIVMPDGETAFVTGTEGRLRSYDLETGASGDALAAVGNTADRYPVLAASAGEGRLLQASRTDVSVGPTTIAVHELADGTLSFPPIEVDGVVTSAAFVGSDRVALTVGEEGDVLVIGLDDGTVIESVPGVTLEPDDVVWTLEPQAGNDGRVLRRPSGLAVAGRAVFVGTADGSLRVFDRDSLELQRTIAATPNTLSNLRPLRDGTILTSGRFGLSRLDPVTGAALWQFSEQETCTNLTVAEQLDTFYCGDPYGRLSERNIDSGDVVRSLDAQNGNTGSLWIAADGTELVSFGTFDPVVARWRLDGSGPVTRVLAPGAKPVAFNHTGDLLLYERGHVLDGNYSAHIMDVETADDVARPDILVAAWTDANTLLGAALTDDSQIRYARYDVTGDALTMFGERIPFHEAAGVVSNELDSGKEHMLFRIRESDGYSLARFDTDSAEIGPRIPVDGIVSWAISRSGDRLVAGTTDGVLVFDATTGDQVGAIPGTDLRSAFVTVTDQLFVGSLSGELTQYDLDSLEPIRTFGGSRGHVFGGAGNADGTLVAISGGDHRVVLYDVASGTRIGMPITVPEGQENHVRVSLDGKWMALGGERVDNATNDSDAFQLWSLQPDDWIEASCRVAGRNLTRDEWDRYIGNLAEYRPTCPELPLRPT